MPLYEVYINSNRVFVKYINVFRLSSTYRFPIIWFRELTVILPAKPKIEIKDNKAKYSILRLKPMSRCENRSNLDANNTSTKDLVKSYPPK